MQDRYEDDYDLGDDDGQRARWRAAVREQLSLWGGAVLALAIVVGVGLWGYRLTEREAMAIPVIRAAQTEAKARPANAAADEAAQSDIASYNAGTGAGDGAVTQITFAPPPDRPASEDVAMGQLSADAAGAEAAGEAVPAAVAPPSDGVVGDASALAPHLSRPAPTRPANLVERARAALNAASEQEELARLAAASAVQIQLGDYATRDETEAEWERIFKDNADILQGRALVVQPTISGGRRRFRLRAGPFRDQTEARAICRALTARGQDCLVAVSS